MKKKWLLIVAAAVIGFAAFATNYTWTGGGNDGLWTTSANWGGSGYPSTSSDVAIFNGDATVSLNTGTATTLSYLKVTAGTVTINGTAGTTLNCTKAAAVDGSGLVVMSGATLVISAPLTFTDRIDKWNAGTLIVRNTTVSKSDGKPWYVAYGTNIFEGTTSVSFPNANLSCGNLNDSSIYMPVFFRDSASVSVKGLGTSASTTGAPAVDFIQEGPGTSVSVGASGISLTARATEIQRYTLKSGTLSSSSISATAGPPSGKTYDQSPTNLWYIQEGGTSTFASVSFAVGSAALRGGRMNFTGENNKFTMGNGTVFEISGGTLGWPRTFNPSGWPKFRYSGTFGVSVPSGSSFEWDWSKANVAPGTVFVYDDASTMKFIRAKSTEGVGLEIGAGRTVSVESSCTISAPRGSYEPWKLTINDGATLLLKDATSRLSLPLDLTVKGTGKVRFNGSTRSAAVAHRLKVGDEEKPKGIYYESDNSFVDAGYTSYICVPYVWIGEGDGVSWNDSRNWDTGTVPPSGTTTAVDISRAATIMLNDAVTLACLVAMPNGAERKTTITGAGSISLYARSSYYTGLIVPEDCELVLDVDLYGGSNNARALQGGGRLTLTKTCPGNDTGATPLLLVDGTLALKGVSALNHYTGSTYDRFSFRGHNIECAADILIEDGTIFSADWLIASYPSFANVNKFLQTGGKLTFNRFHLQAYRNDPWEYTYYLADGELTVSNPLQLGKSISNSVRYPGGSFEMSGGTLTCGGFNGNYNQNYVRLYGGDVYLKGNLSADFETAASIAVTNRNVYTYYLGGVTIHPTGANRTLASGNVWFTGKNGDCTFDVSDYNFTFTAGNTVAGPGGLVVTSSDPSKQLDFSAACTFEGSIVVKGGKFACWAASSMNGPRELIVENASSVATFGCHFLKTMDRVVLQEDDDLFLARGETLTTKRMSVGGVNLSPGTYTARFGNGDVVVLGAQSWLDGTVGDLSYNADNATTTVADATTLSSLSYTSASLGATNTLTGADLTFSDGANIYVAKGATLVIENDVVLGGKVTKTGEGEVVFNGDVTGAVAATDGYWLTVQEGGATFDGAVTGVRLITCGTGKVPVITLNEHCTVTDYAIVLTAYSYANTVTNATGETHQNGAAVDYSAGVFEAIRAATNGAKNSYPLTNPNGGSGRYVLNSGTFKTSREWGLSFMEDVSNLGMFEFVQNGGTLQVMRPLTFARTLSKYLRLTYTLNGGQVEFYPYVEGTHRAMNFINFNGGTVVFKGTSGGNFAARDYFTVSIGGDVTFEMGNTSNSVYFPNDLSGDGAITFNGGNYFFSGGVNIGGLNIAAGTVTLSDNTALAASGETALSLAKTGATLYLNYDGQMPFKTLNVDGKNRGAGIYSATQGRKSVRVLLGGDGELLIREGGDPGTVIKLR